ncbi:MAG: Tfp pilus assembly protein FimT/FimU [Phycisphaerales bacterium]
MRNTKVTGRGSSNIRLEAGVGGERRRRPGAFTLMELLVVILIMGVLLTIAVPSFSAMLRSSEETMAETLLRNALRSGRDAALAGGGRQDGAVVFVYDPISQRYSMITCTKAGEVIDGPPATQVPTAREVFVPLETAAVVQLPKNWMVRGYAPINSIDLSWYFPEMGQQRRYNVDGRSSDWVFPETGFYNNTVVNDGRNRQTFMVRFEAGTGLVSQANGRAALVFLGGVDNKVRTQPAWQRHTSQLKDYRRYVKGVLADPTLTDILKRNLVGDLSGDTVLVKPVKALALGDERKLASSLGVRLDPDTGCLYTLAGVNPPAPRFVTNVTARKISQWIEGNGDLNGNGTPDSREMNYIRDARIYVVDRFTSELREVEVAP